MNNMLEDDEMKEVCWSIEVWSTGIRSEYTECTWL